jgi:hypothetical protein
MPVDKEQIINFFCHNGTDNKGRTLQDMIDFTDEEMEANHDYIQWMFPLHEKSGFNDDCPVLTPEIASVIEDYWHEHPESCLQGEAWRRVLDFYGIGDTCNRTGVGPHSRTYNHDRIKEWCYDGNHNLLRITRIIRSLRLFDDDLLAEYFYKDISFAQDFISNDLSERTNDYWRKAMEDEAWSTMR